MLAVAVEDMVVAVSAGVAVGDAILEEADAVVNRDKPDLIAALLHFLMAPRLSTMLPFRFPVTST
jgi:hypothetical protein